MNPLTRGSFRGTDSDIRGWKPFSFTRTLKPEAMAPSTHRGG